MPQLDLPQNREEEWDVKTTSKGFIYFKMKGTNDCQWEFPRVYDPQAKKYRPVYNKHWKKVKNSKTGAKFWRNTETGITQTCDPCGETYIFESAMVNNIAFLELYFKYGGDINLFDMKRRTPLHHACANGNYDYVNMLIKFGAYVNKRDSAKMTPIFYAVKYHHKSCLRALIEAGADIEVTKPNGDTLIHEAAIYDSAD